jgi:putative membrane protein
MSQHGTDTDRDPDPRDASRRTLLAAERTWLAWWRTALAGSAVSIGVGRLLPDLAKGARWPFTALGIGYGILAIALLIVGAVRQQRTAEALRRGQYSDLSTRAVMYLTAAALVLAVGTLIVVAAGL